MLVAIDFDQTITEHPQGWLEVINTMKAVGMRVIVVTFRQPTCDPHELDWLDKHVEAVIFTGQRNKDQACKIRGFNVDVWIDDTPMSITHDYINWKWELPS
jgi:hypothetical protein